MAIVGTAYIATKVISNNLSKDLKKSVEDSFKDVKPTMKKMGEDLGAEMGKSISEANEKEIEKGTKKTRDSNVFRNLFASMGSKMGGFFSTHFNSETRKRFSGFGNTLMPMLLGALVPVIAVGLQAINAYVGQATALLGAIGPAVAASTVVAGAAFTALGAGLASVLLAFAAETPMLERFKEVAAAVGEEFKGIGESIQEELLPRLARAMGMLLDVIPTLETGLTAIGKSIGEVSVEFANMVTQAANLERLQTVLSGSAVSTREFGRGFVDLTEAALILLAAAQPLTIEFAKWVHSLTEGWAASLAAAEASGALADWFERAGVVAKQLGAIFGAFGRGLGNVFKAGAESGQDLLDRIQAIGERFEEWTESVGGQNALAEWFENADRVGQEFSGLIADIFRAFGELFAQNPDASIEFIQALRESLPILVDAVPGLVALTSAFAEIISTMAESGALGITVGILTTILELLNAIIQVPVLGFFASFALGLAPVGAFLAKIGLLGPLISILKAAVVGLSAALGVSVGWIIAIIAAVVAVVAAIIYAIKHWDQIKEVILNVWDAIKEKTLDAVDAIKDWFSGLMDKLGDVRDWFVEKWNQIVDFTKSVVDALLNFFSPLINFFTTVFTTVISVFKTVWTAFFTFMMLPVRIFVGLVLLAWDAIKEAFSKAWNFISGWISEKWNSLKEKLSGPINRAKELISAGWQAVKGAFSSAWNWAVNWISSTWNSLKDKLAKPVQAAKDKIVAAWDDIKQGAKNIWTSFSNGVSGAVSTVKSKLNGVIGFINKIIDGINTLIRGANKLPGPDLPTIPRITYLAAGGVVSPSRMGTLAMIAEAGQAERVEPLDDNGLSKRDKVLIQALAGSGGANVRVYIGDRELTDIIRVEQEQREFQLTRVLTGGRTA